MKFVKVIAAFLSAVMFSMSAMSNVVFGDMVDDGDSDIVAADEVVDHETGLVFTLLEDGTYSVKYPEENRGEHVDELIIPEEVEGRKVTVIEDRAFEYCNDYLKNITIPESVTSINEGAFSGCHFEDITIPESVIIIGEMAFYACGHLVSVNIPKNVKTIAGGAFAECEQLVAINVDEDNKYFHSEDGILFNKDKTELNTYPMGKDMGKKYEIPKSVTKIGVRAFFGHSELEAIDIHDGITSIGAMAFERCDHISSLIIPESVTDIGLGAFLDCFSLNSVVILGKITEIKKMTFLGIDNIDSLTLPASIERFEENAFECRPIKNIYYEGSESQWNKIVIEDENPGLNGTIIHYGSVDEPDPEETKPAETTPAETTPEETKPTETEPTETKPEETKPTETTEPMPGSSDTANSELPTDNKPGSPNTDSNSNVSTTPSVTSSPSVYYNGEISNNVKISSGAPEAHISSSLSELVNSLLTDEERKRFENGEKVNIVLEVKDIGSDISHSDKQAVEEVLNDNPDYKLGRYLDLSLSKTVGNSEEAITNTRHKITIVIDIPPILLSSSRDYAVIRVHNGEVSILDDKDNNKDTITIDTDKFSTYAIVYRVKSGAESNDTSSLPNNSSNNDKTLNTGIQSNSFIYMVIGMFSFFAFLILCYLTGKNRISEAGKDRVYSKLITWGKNGGRIRRIAALTAIFFVLTFCYGMGMKDYEN